MGAALADGADLEGAQAAVTCPICARGEPLAVVAELGTAWVTAGAEAPLPGYVCVVHREHVEEPYELDDARSAAFWADVMRVARVVARLYRPRKMNYEIHGNTIPHLHVHLFPRYAGDPYEGGPIDPTKASFVRSEEELARLRDALS